MTRPPATLEQYLEQYLDFREGDRSEPPSTADLSENDQTAAAGWLQSLADCEGLSPDERPQMIPLLVPRVEHWRRLRVVRDDEENGEA